MRAFRWLLLRLRGADRRPGVQQARSLAMLVDGYVRVSVVGGRSGERFLSPRVQREQIAGWVAGRDATLGEVFEELDASGARADRPLLERAVRRVELGHSDGIVVARLDRFGRSLPHGLATIERIRAAGGVFVSVADGFDLSTDTGKLILRIMLSLAEFELDRIRANWVSARERSVARGVHGGGHAPPATAATRPDACAPTFMPRPW